MIPISVVTGFLGSGKTTLISRVLRHPAFGKVAVIVNEFGEVGLDHELIAASDDSVLTLTSGCLCCAVQTDLAQTLVDLRQRRGAGLVDYNRVLIETSGIADPGPILQTIIADSDISTVHRVTAVVALIDAVHGEQTLHEHAEARVQVALADRLLISKTDLRSPSDWLLTQLDQLNPGAQRTTTAQPDPTVVFDGTASITTRDRIAVTRGRRGHGDIETFTVIRQKPLPALVLTMLLQAVAEHCGSRLLRLKGLVAIEEMPRRPAVIHGIRHVVSPPDFLDRWPSSDERTRIVFIVRGIPPHFVSRLLDAIEEEVRDALASPSARPVDRDLVMKN